MPEARRRFTHLLIALAITYYERSCFFLRQGAFASQSPAMMQPWGNTSSTISASLAKQVIDDIAQVSPATEVRSHIVEMKDPWDFSEVYTSLRDFAHSYVFDPEREDYLVNITTGTHVAQICWFLLTEAHFIPARLLQLSPPKNREGDDCSGTHSIIDLDLPRYDAIATRFAAEHEEATSFLKSGIATRSGAFNTMSAAGRELFAISRLQKSSGNDADRLRKYLLRFDLSFESLNRT